MSSLNVTLENCFGVHNVNITPGDLEDMIGQLETRSTVVNTILKNAGDGRGYSYIVWDHRQARRFVRDAIEAFTIMQDQGIETADICDLL